MCQNPPIADCPSCDDLKLGTLATEQWEYQIVVFKQEVAWSKEYVNMSLQSVVACRSQFRLTSPKPRKSLAKLARPCLVLWTDSGHVVQRVRHAPTTMHSTQHEGKYENSWNHLRSMPESGKKLMKKGWFPFVFHYGHVYFRLLARSLM